VLEAALTAQKEGRPAALATVVETHGSVPRQAGSKMLIWPDGRIVGTIGGGQRKHADQRQAALAMAMRLLITRRLDSAIRVCVAGRCVLWSCCRHHRAGDR
jgi:xanthine/CO dehydrogenase XdhC/CoxF family maturation factor